MNLEERIEKLERQNRSLRMFAYILPALMVSMAILVGVASPQTGSQKFDIVEANAAIVRAANGKMVASLGMRDKGKSQPNFVLYDSQEHKRAEINFNKEESETDMLLGEAGGVRVFWQVNDSDDPLHYGVNSVMGLPAPEGPIIQTKLDGKENKARALIYSSVDGNFTHDNKTAVAILVEKKGPTLKMFDKEGHTVFSKP